jgi:hypothetical protein
MKTRRRQRGAAWFYPTNFFRTTQNANVARQPVRPVSREEFDSLERNVEETNKKFQGIVVKVNELEQSLNTYRTETASQLDKRISDEDIEEIAKKVIEVDLDFKEYASAMDRRISDLKLRNVYPMDERLQATEGSVAELKKSIDQIQTTVKGELESIGSQIQRTIFDSSKDYKSQLEEIKRELGEAERLIQRNIGELKHEVQGSLKENISQTNLGLQKRIESELSLLREFLKKQVEELQKKIPTRFFSDSDVERSINHLTLLYQSLDEDIGKLKAKQSEPGPGVEISPEDMARYRGMTGIYKKAEEEANTIAQPPENVSSLNSGGTRRRRRLSKKSRRRR